MDKISVIITTVNRECVINAIQSVLNQKNVKTEIIVVVDGASQEINRIIKQIFKNSVKLINIPTSLGGNHARNTGISYAKYNFIALLDDDDTWREDKLLVQLNKYKELSFEHEDIILFSQMSMIKEEKIIGVEPLIPYSQNIPIADYLFDKKFNGKFQTSTIFTSKATFIKEKFDELIPKHQDWDWAINCYHRGFHFEQIFEPLTNYTVSSNGVGSVQNQGIEYDYEWLKRITPKINSNAFNSYLTRYIFSALAAEKNSRENKVKILLKIFKDNKIKLYSKVALIGILKIFLKS